MSHTVGDYFRYVCAYVARDWWIVTHNSAYIFQHFMPYCVIACLIGTAAAVGFLRIRVLVLGIDPDADDSDAKAGKSKQKKSPKTKARSEELSSASTLVDGQEDHRYAVDVIEDAGKGADLELVQEQHETEDAPDFTDAAAFPQDDIHILQLQESALVDRVA